MIGIFIVIALAAPIIAPPARSRPLQDPTRRLQRPTQTDDVKMVGNEHAAFALLVETHHEDGPVGSYPGDFPGTV